MCCEQTPCNILELNCLEASETHRSRNFRETMSYLVKREKRCSREKSEELVSAELTSRSTSQREMRNAI